MTPGRRFVIQEFEFEGSTRTSEQISRFAEELAEAERFIVEVICTAALAVPGRGVILFVTFERIDLSEPIPDGVAIGKTKGTIQ